MIRVASWLSFSFPQILSQSGNLRTVEKNITAFTLKAQGR